MGIIGVDEAGKGPVLGSMFVAAVRISSEGMVPDSAVDSKKLTKKQREKIANIINKLENCSIGIEEIKVEEIDMVGSNMNNLTAMGHARAISQIVKEGDKIYLDAADVNAQRFGEKIGRELDVEVQIFSEHKADEKYPIVSAASIIAKVERDAHVSNLARNLGEIGSGYPADVRTQSFLKKYLEDNGKLPECARLSWKTSKNLLNRHSQKTIGEY